MKVFIVALLLLVSPIVAMACKEGFIPSDVPGVCMESPVSQTNPAWVSSEKPPEDKMPSWQREGVTVLNQPSTAQSDIDDDKKKVQADQEGKQKAGIKP